MLHALTVTWATCPHCGEAVQVLWHTKQGNSSFHLNARLYHCPKMVN